MFDIKFFKFEYSINNISDAHAYSDNNASMSPFINLFINKKNKYKK